MKDSNNKIQYGKIKEKIDENTKVILIQRSTGCILCRTSLYDLADF